MRVVRILEGTEEERENLFNNYPVKWVSVLKNGFCEVVFFTEKESEIPKVSMLSEMMKLLKENEKVEEESCCECGDVLTENEAMTSPRLCSVCKEEMEYVKKKCLIKSRAEPKIMIEKEK